LDDLNDLPGFAGCRYFVNSANGVSMGWLDETVPGCAANGSIDVRSLMALVGGRVGETIVGRVAVRVYVERTGPYTKRQANNILRTVALREWHGIPCADRDELDALLRQHREQARRGHLAALGIGSDSAGGIKA
jgi:hypothetical protein